MASSPPWRDRVVLVGMMGSGKSTVARMVAERLDAACIDLDEAVESRSGCSIAELFSTAGEDEFRRTEAGLLAEALRRPPPAVIAVGGGAVTSADSRRLLAHVARVVWLRARPATLAARVEEGQGRPLLSGGDVLATLTALDHERQPFYAEVADAVVDVDDLTAEEVADRVLAQVLTPADDA